MPPVLHHSLVTGLSVYMQQAVLLLARTLLHPVAGCRCDSFGIKHFASEGEFERVGNCRAGCEWQQKGGTNTAAQAKQREARKRRDRGRQRRVVATSRPQPRHATDARHTCSPPPFSSTSQTRFLHLISKTSHLRLHVFRSRTRELHVLLEHTSRSRQTSRSPHLSQQEQP